MPPASDAGARRAAPLLLLLGSVALYIGVALSTGQTRMLEVEGVVGLLQRMVALGIVAIGQTFVILAGSIDLSVANLISVAAVLASFIMQGRPEMMLVAVVGGARGLGRRRAHQRRCSSRGCRSVPS